MTDKLYVLTGGLVTGKDRILDCLSNLGYPTFPELEQEVIDEYFQGKTPRQDPDLYARKWFEKKVVQFDFANSGEIGFFNRGFIDPFSIYPFLNKPVPSELMHDIKNRKYAEKVFLVEPIPKEWFGGVWYKKLLSKEESVKFHQTVSEVYKREGYTLISVPATDIGQRADFILSHL